MRWRRRRQSAAASGKTGAADRRSREPDLAAGHVDTGADLPGQRRGFGRERRDSHGYFVRPDDHSRCGDRARSEEHTSELQSQSNLVCRLLLEKKKIAKVFPQWGGCLTESSVYPLNPQADLRRVIMP